MQSAGTQRLRSFSLPGLRFADVRALGASPGWLALILAFLIWSIPSLITLANDFWRTPQGAQGPIILLMGATALAWQLRGPPPTPRLPLLAPVALALTALVYIAARLTGILSLEIACVVASVALLTYGHYGTQGLRKAWVPLLFLAALIPPPFTLMLELTRALKLWLSQQAVTVLDLAGLQVAHDGTTLFIDNYIVVMEAACSGLNSLLSLSAIGFFFIFWQRRRTLPGAFLLLALLVPIAIAANFVRVLALLVGVHQLGPAVLQTALHPGAGIAMFAVALALLVAADALVERWERASR